MRLLADHYETLLASFAQAVWETDAQGLIVSDSPSWRAYTGQTVEQWLGEGWVAAIHPHDRPYALQQWQQAVDQQQPVNAEFRLRSPDGGWRWTNVRATAIRDTDGTIQKWVGLNIDISERKRAEERLDLIQSQQWEADLRGSQDQLRATLDSSVDMIQVFEAVRNEQDEIIDFIWILNNHAAEKIYGDVVGKSLLHCQPGVVEEGIFAAFTQVINTGEPQQYEKHYVQAPFEGWFYQSVVKLGDGVATTTADIRGRKQAEESLRQSEANYRQLATHLDEQVQQRTQQLERSVGDLKRSNNNLQTFAYVASHDLQEPLRKIQQFGDLLKTRFADSVTGEELVYLERMQLAASRMSTLIKDLLSFSRISTQRNTEEGVSLNEVVAEIVSVLDVLIAETGAQVDVEELPVLVGDRAQLGQLWQNLLSNALKFHQPAIAPRIRISSQRLEADQLPPAIKPARRSLFYHRIAVADNGIGFNEKYLDRIFQLFQRLHGKNAFAGTGMGLAICEKIVTNHGGVLTAESQPGQGATFYVYLPA